MTNLKDPDGKIHKHEEGHATKCGKRCYDEEYHRVISHKPYSSTNKVEYNLIEGWEETDWALSCSKCGGVGRIGNSRSQNLADVIRSCYEITNGCQLDIGPTGEKPSGGSEYYPTITVKKNGEKIGKIWWDEFCGGYWEAKFD